MMSKVQAIENELQKLSHEEVCQVRDWLEDFLEDQLQFTPEFEAEIEESEREMAAGVHARIRRLALLLEHC